MAVCPPGSGAGSQGFTLIELVVVIVVAVVLASVTGAHFFDQPTFAQRGFADELGSALRFAQKVAVETDCPTRLNLTASAYIVQQQAASGNTCNLNDTTWSTTVLDMNGATLQDSAPNGVTASPTGMFVFNGAGALTSSPATRVTVGSHSIAIDPATGFVQVQ
jgi:MSHA pilin protein MshC